MRKIKQRSLTATVICAVLMPACMAETDPEVIEQPGEELAQDVPTPEAETDEIEKASGGGCRSNAGTSACISYSGGNRNVVADFYVDRAVDSSTHQAYLNIYKDGRSAPDRSEYFRLYSSGHYGPITSSTITLPASRRAYAQLVVYTLDWREHFRTTSPTVYYP